MNVEKASLESIERAPIGSAGPIAEPDASQEIIEKLSAEASRLASDKERLELELKALKAERRIDQVRAELMEPYANKVYVFLCYYCAVVAAFLLLNGFRRWTGFELSDAVMGIIAGSTAVSAIGLVGFVVSGLFRSPPERDNQSKS